jgi:hypothetical protein
LAAAVVTAVQPGIQGIGVGWLFTTVSLVLFISRISIMILLKFGPKWRKQRLQRQEEPQQQQK